jgi:protein tyrosine/serine phosphatase
MTAWVLSLNLRSKPGLKKCLWVLGAPLSVIALLALAAAGFYAYLQWDDNFHVVEPGVFYRSAQPEGEELRAMIQRHHIRTVLNLRGPNPGRDWYDDELRVSRQEDIHHLDYALSAEQPLTVAQMNEVLRMIEQAPKPILVHCHGGSDRSGLVSALYQTARGKPPAEVDHQLSLIYGHFPYLWSKSGAMDRSLALYRAQQKAPVLAAAEAASR